MIFLTSERDLVPFLAVLENSVLHMVWDSSHVKSYVRTLNFRSDVTFAPPRKTLTDVRKRSLYEVKCKIMFNVIGKKK